MNPTVVDREHFFVGLPDCAEFFGDFPYPRAPCVPVFVRPNPTAKTSFTTPANTTLAAVKGEGSQENFTYVRKATYIWDRLFSYISPIERTKHAGLVPAPVHLSDCPNLPREPPGSWARFHKAFTILEAAQYESHPIPMASDSSVQTVIDKQIFDIVNISLKMRYENTAELVHPGSIFLSASTVPVNLNAIGAAVFSPCWATMNRSNSLQTGPKASGLCDSLLYRSFLPLAAEAPTETQVALFNGKAPWVYTTEDFNHIYQGSNNIFDSKNQFKVNPNHSANCLLQQLWGQFVATGVKVGWITNTDIAIVVVKDNDGLTLSCPMPWTHPNLRACVVALSMMAIDEKQWLTLDPKRDIQSLLCPASEREQIMYNEDAPGNDRDTGIPDEPDESSSESNSQSGSDWHPSNGSAHSST